ncbi:uncharacterized protein LACBIDRAFT_293313 [Laccaria bicolor S238N-H82]|uniref:Predicted protein n=1 Tax=Laccaria bicolor (strain S238N-H82 / ATCC MYA-4686) TaxID=486041 RepID=B0D2V8_LACBS|nr:uncharacterized protein LACBIDRAFT_293313 [Laccaria bicolor S238N-H82]EDR10820.1 predicted protein [Laccaria bicolor S238N-H82]|eukprot:XP_001878121.1 predicted protein [Laccaria bicolor S238N-H82]
MALSQLLLPSLTVVLTSESGSTVLRDYQQAQSREIQIPLFGPRDDGLMDTIDARTPTGYIVYKCEYSHEQDTATLFEEKADRKRSFWCSAKSRAWDANNFLHESGVDLGLGLGVRLNLSMDGCPTSCSLILVACYLTLSSLSSKI